METKSITNFLTFLILATFFSLQMTKVAQSANIEGVDNIELVLENHQFTPSEINIGQNRKLVLTVVNKDNTAEEFESDDLRKEKIIGANSSITMNIGPLSPGSYKFEGEFNPNTAQGVINVR